MKLRVIGQCFDSSDAHEMSQRVLDAYQNFGYFRATVNDPAIKVMDDTRYPRPVSPTFDVEEGQQFVVADVIWHWKGTDGSALNNSRSSHPYALAISSIPAKFRRQWTV